MLMAILLSYEIGYPDGQTERPLNEVKGEKNQINMAQNIVLKKRDGIGG